jgi:hypothetical protein
MRVPTEQSEGELVEVKTISPEKRAERVCVKRSGDFQKLLIVRISEDLSFASRIFDRSELSEGSGAIIKARWRNSSEAGIE